MEKATDYVSDRSGRIGFAVVDETGRVRGNHIHEVHYSASVVKAMLMVAYLRRPAVSGRSLTRADKALLRPMITRSDNRAASRVFRIVGNDALRRLARKAGMKDFSTAPGWPDTRFSAYDQALLFKRIDLFVPGRHRSYAMSLLAGIVPSQRWGLGKVIPKGFELYFKGGWRRGLENQVGLYKRGKTRVSVAVLTDHDPSSAYGRETIRGTAARLLKGIETALPAD